MEMEQAAESGRDEKGMFLVWEDLTVVVPNFGTGHTRRLLDGLNGYAEPNRIMAIMGPSGSGKSTLLDALAGRLSGNVVMTGKVLLNGRKRRLDYGVLAYVTQEDILLGTLTVREAMSYSANLRFPANMTKEEINNIVEETIMEMGLQDCADRLIGNWHLRGISVGEKKRLSIALEILTRPRFLFLDEPTSGLDSASAFFVVQTLRNTAHDGRTVISSIHQPSRRLSGNVVMTGKVLLNGRKRRLDYGVLAYVTQEDILLGTLTVREAMSYSANLRFPANMTKEEINNIVEETIMEMGLQDCADRLIGNWHLRGISVGEKKRLSIALEILTRPRFLFLDEPTSGLDSASAFFVVQTLRNTAHDGRTVISSIHQPSSEVFAVFDDLFLLSGGQTVYFGAAEKAVEFFAKAGFPCPSRRNPSDHFLRCINSDFDTVTMTMTASQRIPEQQSLTDSLMNLSAAEIKTILVEKYHWSEYASTAREKIKEFSNIEGDEIESKSKNQATWWKQLSTLTHRSFMNMSRDVGYYWIRITIYVALSLCVGTVFFDVGSSYKAIFARGACGAFISGFMTFMSIGGFPSFIEEIKVFNRERLNGYYGIAVYILSNFLSSFPFVAVMSIATGIITFYMVKFRPEFSHLLYVCLDLISCIAVVESSMMIIASLVPNFLMGVTIGAGYIGIMMMTAGYFRLLPDLPKFFWRYPTSYINYAAWGLQGAYKNDMIGLEFDPLVPGGPKLKGELILTTMLGMQVDHSKWWDLAVVVVILILHRILFFFILKFKERASPFLRKIYSKQTLQRIKKQPSFRKAPSFPSNRHQAMHPLSSQEGLNSPLH